MSVSQTASSNRRRRYIVSSLQVKIAIMVMLLFISVVLAIWWEINGSLAEFQRSIARDFPNSPLVLRIAIYSRNMSLGLLLKSAFVMVILWLTTIISLHHLLGPLYRLKICLKSIQNGDYFCRMHLRKRDVLLDVRDSFNQMAEALEARSVQRESDLQAVRQILSTLAPKVDSQMAQEISRADSLLQRQDPKR